MLIGLAIWLIGAFLCWCCVEFQYTVDKKNPNRLIIATKSVFWPFTLLTKIVSMFVGRKPKPTNVGTIRAICYATNNEDFVGKLIVISQRSGKITEKEAKSLGYELGIDWLTWKDTV